VKFFHRLLLVNLVYQEAYFTDSVKYIKKIPLKHGSGCYSGDQLESMHEMSKMRRRIAPE